MFWLTAMLISAAIWLALIIAAPIATGLFTLAMLALVAVTAP